MIEVEIHGRLGNHLFQYAFAYTLAKEFNSSFRFVYAHRMSIEAIFELPSFRKPLYQRHKKLSRWIDRLNDKFIRNKEELILVEDFEKFIPQANRRYKGFYQSYHFFSKYEDEIRREFKFKKKHVASFNKKYGALFSSKKVLGVHIRRGDYTKIHIPDLGAPGLHLPIQFYKENIAKLLEEDMLVYFASDDIEYVKKEFGEREQYIYSSEDMLTDFMALTYAHQLIISNSSFSWWAGFLNSNKNKRVIAPKYHLGFKVDKEVPKGIMYKGFEWVKVPYKPAKNGTD